MRCGRRFALSAAMLMLLASFVCICTVDTTDSDGEFVYRGLNIDHTWNSTFAANNGGYNNVDLAPGYGKCTITLTVQKVSSPSVIDYGWYDHLENEELVDLHFSIAVTSSIGSNTGVLKITIEDVAELPEVSILKISDHAEKKNRLSITLHIRVGEVIVSATETGNQVSVLNVPGYVNRLTWTVHKYAKNDDIAIMSISSLREGTRIIYDGANSGTVSIFSIPDKTSLNSLVDLDFVMYSGNIGTLKFLSIPYDVTKSIGNSYDVMPTPIHNADVTLIQGKIGVLNPTDSMVSVTNYNLEIQKDMSIDRLYTTGENGKYSNVEVSITGAKIGYMTNLASRIGSLSYDIQSGSIDYLCIGANSEHYHSSNIAKMPTSYVSGDVMVHIGQSVENKRCIMGSGILNIPNILCNGTSVIEPVIHMVVVDASGIRINNDSAFLTDTRTSAFQMSEYRLGGNVYSRPLMDSFMFNGKSTPVYSEEGIWDSPSTAIIPTGGMLSMNSEFSIPRGGTFFVDEGGIVYNSDDMLVYGSIITKGKFQNNSVIQCSQESSIDGEITGIGFVGDYVYYTMNTDKMSVMSNRTAVVIEQPDYGLVESVSSILSDDRRSVSITAGSEPIYAKRIMLSLENEGPTGDFDAVYRLDVRGIDPNVLSVCASEVRVHTDQNKSTAVYVYDRDLEEYVMIVSDNYVSEIMFDTLGYNKFYLLTYIDDLPNPNPAKSSGDDMTTFDYVLVSSIIAVFSVTVYALITMKRD